MQICSKILGIGTAERNWKQVKFVKTGQRGIAKLLSVLRRVEYVIIIIIIVVIIIAKTCISRLY